MTSAPSSAPARSGDHATFAELGLIPGVEVLSARFRRHRFGSHTHDAWGFGAVSGGVQDLSAHVGMQHLVRAGEISVIPPGEVHAGRVVGSDDCEYVMFYVPDGLVQDCSRDYGLGRFDVGMKALAAPRLSALMRTFAQTAIDGKPEDLQIESDWHTLIGGILPQFASQHPRPIAPASGSPAMSRAFSLLIEHWAESVSVSRLAKEADMSPAYFCRQFSSTYGLSPHRYQLDLRIKHAKAMIARGVPIAEAADATGFADQSHLGRHLKHCLGITPGELGKRSLEQKRSIRSSKRSRD